MGDAARCSFVDAGNVIGLDPSDGIFIGVLVLGVAVIVLSAFAMRNRPLTRANDPTAWQKGAGDVVATGRKVIDLTAAHHPGEPGTGLTVQELGMIEGALDQLLSQVRDVQSINPTPEASHRMKLVAAHASSLNAAVRTERRVRLASLDLKDRRLDTLALEFVSERSALDEVLSELSSELEGVL